jgi:hypothetical protein
MTIKLDIVSQYNGKGTKKAKSDLDNLTSTAKKLAGAFGVAFGLGAIKNFAAASVKAYAADQAAAKSLELQLKNTGNAFATKSVEAYIANLQKVYHVLDDNLRPAYQTLLTASGSVLDSQKALNVALDISAATGKSLEEVSAALAKGYSGQTTAITRLGVGIDKATLASGDMNKILDVLSGKFKGQAANAADTYQGKLNALAVASANVKEIIGKDIVDSLSLLGKDGNIDALTGEMEKFAYQIGDVILGLGVILSKLEAIGKFIPKGDASGYLMAIPVVGAYLEGIAKLGQAQRPPARAGRSYQGGQTSNDVYIANQKQAQIEKERLAALKKQQAILAAQLKAQKDAAALKKSQGILDIQQAGIIAALQGKISENEKLRLELQLALLTGNAKEADRLSNALLLSQSQLTGLASFISNLPKALNPFADYPMYVQQALAELAKIQNSSALAVSPNKYDQIQAKLTAQNISMGIDAGAAAGLAASSARLQAQADAYFAANPNIDPMTGAVINVTVEVGGQQLTDIVTSQQINNSASGISAKLNRLALMD